MEYIQPTVGPIVGQNTNDYLRIMVRGDERYEDKQKGFLLLSDNENFLNAETMQFKIHPNYDYTGVAIIPKLEAKKTYYYKVGIIIEEHTNTLWETVFGNDVIDNMGEFPPHKIKILSNNEDDPTTFVAGSCRYVFEGAGIYAFDKQSDKTYRTINKLIENGEEIEFMLHMGDQIYADDLNVFMPDTKLGHFFNKYRNVFSTPHFSELVSKIGNYMTLDDHEIENDWPLQKSAHDKNMYFAAMTSYQAYQMSHSPVISVEGNRLAKTPKKWWYEFSSGCADFFVTDTRTERSVVEGNSWMINNEQMEALKEFLLNKKDRVKCVVTATPFLYDHPTSFDKFGGDLYIHQKKEIMEFIYDNDIEKSVFISGDIHYRYSGYATRKKTAFGGKKDIKIHEIITSPLFYPFQFVDIVADGKTDQYKAPYQIQETDWVYHPTSKHEHENHFAKVTFTPDDYKISFIERKGEVIEEVEQKFDKRSKEDIEVSKRVIPGKIKLIKNKIIEFFKDIFNFFKILGKL